jgi:hypothetical protein
MAEAATEDDMAVFQKLKDDFPHFASRCLKIRTKEHGVIPFVLNDAQQYLHEIAEKQLAEFGWVRILILKGRQQGMSTYVEGRFYWKVTHEKGQRAHILTHEAEATANLFAMVARFHENNAPEVKPHTDRDSGKELNFDALDSGYKVGTAGTKGTGRSSTIQYFHGSEVAFWPHAETHATGIMQAVPSTSGEVFLESTSDGMGNYFHQQWVHAVAGLNEFIAVFIPWFWQSEYTLPVPEGALLDEDEAEYADLHEVSMGHMLWRRFKIMGFKNANDDFKREYPATPQEAFESAGYRQLIPAEDVARAVANQQNEGIEARGALVMGVDPARFGDDRLGIAIRQGRVCFDLVGYAHKMDQMEIVGLCRQILDSLPIDRCFVDVGMGVGVIDRLHELDYDQVQEVNFGGGAFNSLKYTNRRNEMWQEMAEWFDDENVVLLTAGVTDLKEKIEAATMDLCSVEYKFNSRNIKVLEDKDATKDRLGLSPDLGDALALTFAEPVALYHHEPSGPRYQGRSKKTGY